MGPGCVSLESRPARSCPQGGPGPSPCLLLGRAKRGRRSRPAPFVAATFDLDQHPGAAERRPLTRVFDRRCLAWDWHGECMGKFGCASGELLLPRRFILAISPEWNVWPSSQGNASALGRGAKQINGPPWFQRRNHAVRIQIEQTGRLGRCREFRSQDGSWRSIQTAGPAERMFVARFGHHQNGVPLKGSERNVRWRQTG